MLLIENVNTHYGQIQALHDVSLEINQGEIITLIGANGAGKTTLMMTICGDPKASSGEITFEGEPLRQFNTPEIMRKGLAIVPEGRRVFSAMTVEENLYMGSYFRTREQAEETVQYVLELFPRLEERFKQRAGTMPGGEQQILAIGRALMLQPKLLILDEPSLGLAPIIIKQIFDIIERLRDEGVTIFLVEQNANQALRIADRGYVLENGRIVKTDSGANLLTDESVQQAYLGG
ncbi:ABC transporter ATP-binding protein [Amphritea sp.]|uniref:ABC transporter ATP-binding protein n=1 Tax=Amphritea sp. TaxID=1872502 RepID=UPI003D0A5466